MPRIFKKIINKPLPTSTPKTKESSEPNSLNGTSTFLKRKLTYNNGTSLYDPKIKTKPLGSIQKTTSKKFVSTPPSAIIDSCQEKTSTENF